MRFQKQNKSALLWVEFCPVDRKPAQKAHGEGYGCRLCAQVLEYVEELVRQLKDTFWKPLLSLTASTKEDPGTALILRLILLFSTFLLPSQHWAVFSSKLYSMLFYCVGLNPAIFPMQVLLWPKILLKIQATHGVNIIISKIRDEEQCYIHFSFTSWFHE